MKPMLMHRIPIALDPSGGRRTDKYTQRNTKDQRGEKHSHAGFPLALGLGIYRFSD
jgi:hypothetical protein